LECGNSDLERRRPVAYGDSVAAPDSIGKALLKLANKWTLRRYPTIVYALV
jgi:hypothetical protein